MAPWYYIGPLFGGLAPWSLLLPWALWRAVKEREQHPGPFFLALWWSAIVLFFQLAAYKRARYLLPTLPPAALLVGWQLASRLPTALERVHDKPWWTFALLGLSIIIGLSLVVGAMILWGIADPDSFFAGLLTNMLVPEASAALKVYGAWLATHFGLSALWLCAFALCLGFFLHFLWSQRYKRALAALLGALVLLYAGGYASWLIAMGDAASPHAYAHRVLEKLDPQQPIAFINPYDEKGVPVLFVLQEHAPLKDVQWPWGASQPRLPSGYYLVSENRRKELVSTATGTWIEVLRDTEATQWPITLFFYSASDH